MSELYPDLISTFPEAIDSIDNFVDITITTLPLAQQYYAKYNAGDIIGANKILEDNPQLKYSQINASTLNPIVDAIKAIERFYMSDVQQYLVEIVKYKGEWNSNAKYVKYNTVNYLNDSALVTFMCISNDTPIGTKPTNTTYWIPLTMRGEKGESGLGLTPRGVWSELTQYYTDDMVSYNNALWACREANVGYLPNVSSQVWYCVLSVDTVFSSMKILDSEIDAIIDGTAIPKDDL